MLPSSNEPRAILSAHTSLGTPMDRQPENALYRAAFEEPARLVSEEAKVPALRNQQIAETISVGWHSGKHKQRPKQSRPRRKRR